MKHLIPFLCLSFLLQDLVAQTSFQGMKYQAVIRDADRREVTNQEVEIRLSIRDGEPPTSGSLYQEDHKVTTGEFGLVSLVIGQGRAFFGTFDSIPWDEREEYWLQVLLDLDLDGQFEDLGASRLHSVPFAFHARTVEDKDDADADPSNEIQMLSIEGNQLSISHGNTINLPATGAVDADSDATNELQQLSLNGHELSLTKGNSVNLPISVPDNDGDPSNELQDINATKNGILVEMDISNGNGTTFSIQDEDADPSNELQSLSVSGDQVTLSQNGGSFTLPSGASDDQQLSLNGTTLSIEDGNDVNLALLATPWTRKTGYLSYDKGNVRVENDQGESANIWPYTVVVHRGNDRGSLSGREVHFQDEGDIVTIYGQKLMQMRKVGSSVDWDYVLIDPDKLEFNTDLGKRIYLGPNEEQEGTLRLYPSGSTHHNVYLGGNGLGGSTLELSERDQVGIFASVVDKVGLINTMGKNGYPNTFMGADIFDQNNGMVSVMDSNGMVVAAMESKDVSDLGAKIWSRGSIFVPDPYRGGNFKAVEMSMNGLNTYDLRIGFQTEVPGIKYPGWHTRGSWTYDGIRDLALLYSNFVTGDTMRADYLHADVVSADVKNFRIDHPTDDSKEIWYASLEGPEAAAYVRGSATLENGEAFISFAEHFRHVANPETMTVILTPLSAETYGLAAIEKSAKGIRVKELQHGQGNFDFDWEVKCVRQGHEDFEVVRKKK